jgi:hypothetical protein
MSPCLLLLLAPARVAAITFPTAEEAAGADLARLIHKTIVAKLPTAYEDKSGWGQTIPLPDRLILPRLKRTMVKVGDHMEVPDGTWRKLRLRLEDPDRDLHVRIRGFKQLGPTTYRTTYNVEATLRAEADVQRWRNGVELADLTARADVRLVIRVECDSTARLATDKLPPRLVLDPDLKDLKLTLKEFTPKAVTFRRAGVTVEGSPIEAVGAEVKDLVQALMESKEPDIRKGVNETLKKDPLPAAEVLKAAAPLMKRK